MDIREFQVHIWRIYSHHDSRRGLDKTYAWLKREVEELGEAIKSGNRDNIMEELADVLAWLSSVATLLNVDLEEAALGRYGKGCPKCGSIPCKCPFREA
ncbi:nucleotide pyrophosphohydrolase [Candidatus Geothermarchaeota archaeon ex4572_27]|nr:MAG: nucleotide pyrophosphohydrolase [Candidatus Geothermarchaeota archaeon ex4572_27]